MHGSDWAAVEDQAAGEFQETIGNNAQRTQAYFREVQVKKYLNELCVKPFKLCVAAALQLSFPSAMFTIPLSEDQGFANINTNLTILAVHSNVHASTAIALSIGDVIRTVLCFLTFLL